MNNLITIKEFAEAWGCNKSNVYQIIEHLRKQGKSKHKYFKFFKFGSVYMIQPNAEFEKFKRSKKCRLKKNEKKAKYIATVTRHVDLVE